MPKLVLPWNEVLDIEQDIEQFSMDIMRMSAEYYVDRPEPTLIVVTSSDFKLGPDNDTIVVRSCKVRFIEEWPDDPNEAETEQVWQDFQFIPREP